MDLDVADGRLGAVPRDEVLAGAPVVSDRGRAGVEARVALGAHVREAQVVGADLARRRIEALGEDLVLALGDVTPPRDEVLARGAVRRDGRVLGVEVEVALGAGDRDPRVVGPHLGARRGEALDEDLLRARGLSQVPALPRHQVLVRPGVVGDGGLGRLEVGVAVRAHGRDAELAAERGAAGVEQSAPDLELLAGGVPGPHRQVLVGARVVGHRGTAGHEAQVAVGPHLRDALLGVERRRRRGLAGRDQARAGTQDGGQGGGAAAHAAGPHARTLLRRCHGRLTAASRRVSPGRPRSAWPGAGRRPTGRSPGAGSARWRCAPRPGRCAG